MAAPDYLHQLIHSLTPAEKRYININYIKTHNNGKELAMFIKALEKLTDYSEEKVKSKLKATKLINNFSVEKLRLTELVLKAMRHYHEMSTIEYEVQNQYKEVIFLYDRGNFEYSLKRYKVAKKNAKRFELFKLWLDMVEWERKAVLRLYDAGVLEHIDKLRKEREIILDKIYNYNNYLNIYTDCFLLSQNKIKEKKHKKKKLEKLLSLKEIKDQKLAKSFRASHLFFSSNTLIKKFTGSKKNKILKSYADLLNLWENNPHFIKAEREMYNVIICNYLSSSSYHVSDEEYSKIRSKVSIPVRSDLFTEAQYFQNIESQDVIYNLTKGNFDKLEQLVPTIEIGLVKYSKIVQKSRQQNIIYNITIGFFLNQKYNEALTWINRLMNCGWEYNIHLEIFGKMLELICKYEIGKSEVDLLLRNLKRFLNKTETKIGYEDIFIKHFSLIINMPRSGKEFKAECSEFLDDLEAVKANKLRKNTGFYELKFWLQSKIENQHTADIYRDYVKKEGLIK